MRKARLLFSRDLGEYLKSKLTFCLIIFFILSAVMLGFGMYNVAKGMDDLHSEKGYQIWTTILGTVLIMYSFVPYIICIPALATKPLTYEKAGAVVMSLLATQLRPADVWRGKGWALFFPAFISSYASMGVLLIFFMQIVTLPVTVLACCFCIMPITMLLFSMITIQLYMTKSVDLAIAPSYVAGFLIAAIFVVGAITGLFAPGSITFLLVCICIFVITFIIEKALGLNTTVEKTIV
jgi:ABC-2 type transport system permease protein